MSRHLNSRQVLGINKAGDFLIPGDGELPAFSSTNCVRAIDRILDFMPASDLGDLKMLLMILGWMPRFAIGWLLRFLEGAPAMGDGGLGPLLRLVRLGVRGLVMSLYYGDERILKALDYKVRVYTDDLRPTASTATSAPVSTHRLADQPRA